MIGRVLDAPCCFGHRRLIDDCDVIIDFATVEQAMFTRSCEKAQKTLICQTTGSSQEQRRSI